MEFTRANLETLKAVGNQYDTITLSGHRILLSEIAAFALAQLDKIEGLELDAEDAKADIEALDQQGVLLRARALSAEAERDILQWASEHAGGEGFRAGSGAGGGCGGGGGRKVTEDGWYVHKFGPLGEWISSEPKSPDPYDASFKIETGTDPETVIGDGCDCGIVRIPESPERPHEALVWAIYHAALSASDGYKGSDHTADLALSVWRARWPEPGK